MARTATRLELQNRAYARGEFASQTDRFPGAEVQGYINESVADFHDFLIGAWGADYFETDYSPRWESSSESGTLATIDVEGSKVLDVTLNAATSGTDYVGPRLLWRKIPSGGSAEVSFDFSLVEVPNGLTESGLLWFGRIGALGSVSAAFGGELRSGGIDYTAIISAGPAEESAGPKFTWPVLRRLLAVALSP
jgi:hypothetical protein